jgi:hypothetical protein
MTASRDPILDLVAAMTRARDSGLTDADSAKRDAWFRLLEALKSACDEAHSTTDEEHDSGTKLGTKEILEVLAAICGWHIGAYTDGPVGELVVFLKFTEDVTRTLKLVREVRK